MSVFADMTDRQQPSVANVVPFKSCRTIRETVTEYCKQLNLSYVQTESCVEVAAVLHSAEQGKKTADRIHDKMRAIRTRFGTRDDDPTPPAEAA